MILSVSAFRAEWQRLAQERDHEAARQKARRRILGLDVGEKTIGLAISDPDLKVASPLRTIMRSKFQKDAAELFAIADEREAGAFIIGYPLNMNGSEGPRCQSIRHFAENLLAIRDIPIALWDERLSTIAATRPMIEADLSRAKRKAKIDQAAAAFILQGALDAMERDRV